MARTKAMLGSGARLSDFLSASLLARVFPSEAVHAALDAHGRNSKRTRRFPAVAGVYYCMALNLYPEAAYEEVFMALTQGLAWASGVAQAPRVAKSSISALRSRVGYEPLQELMRHHCKPLARIDAHPEAFYAGLRVVAIDGSNFELPDEEENVTAFGYPGSRTGHAAYPQAQCVVLVECATHAVLAANIGDYRSTEWKLCGPLLADMDSTMLCLADRGFRGIEHWRAAQASGAQLLWRTAINQQLPVHKSLPDHSFISALYPSKGSRSEQHANALAVRVIEYSLPAADGSNTRYRLITTLMDPQAAPALELAALYHQRWQVESVFDELKTHQLQSRRVFRSKTAELVRQEFYGWILAHYAVRWLLHQGASRHKLRHADQSFVAHLNALRVNQPPSGAFSPSKAKKAPPLV